MEIKSDLPLAYKSEGEKYDQLSFKVNLSTSSGSWNSESSGTTYTYTNETDLLNQLFNVINGYLITAQNWNDLVNEVNSPDYSTTLTQNASIFAQGTGKDSNDLDIDVSSSVVNGKVSVGVKGNTLTNIVENGDFSDGTNGWVYFTNGTPVITNNELTFSIRANYGDSLIRRSAILQPNTKYFIRAKMKANTINQITSIGIRTTGGTKYKTTVAGEYYIAYSAFVTGSLISSNQYIDVLANHSSIESPTDTVTIDGKNGILAIDMGTDSSNPLYNLTADQMNERIPNYFDGTKSTVNARLTSFGKNLANKEDRLLDKIISNLDGTISTNTLFDLFKIPVIGGQTYTRSHSGNIAWLDINLNFVSGYTGSTLTQSAPTNARWLYQNVTKANIDVFQLEQGTTATPYEPYKESTAYYNETLRSLPNGVKDEINDSGEKIQRTQKTTLDGSRSWLYQSDGAGYKVVKLAISDIKGDTATASGSARVIKDTGVELKEYIGTYDFGDIFYVNNSMEIRIAVKDTDSGWEESYVPSQADIQAYFLAHPHTLTYQLANPIVTQLSLPDLASYENGTVIVDQVREEQVTYNATTANGIDITDTTYPIKALESVYKIEFTEQGEVKTPIDLANCTVAVDSLSFTITGAVDGELYRYVYEPTVKGTLPEIEASYPLNTKATILDNNAMIQDLNKKNSSQDWQILNMLARLEAHGI